MQQNVLKYALLTANDALVRVQTCLGRWGRESMHVVTHLGVVMCAGCVETRTKSTSEDCLVNEKEPVGLFGGTVTVPSGITVL
jgi:hypothetical protein